MISIDYRLYIGVECKNYHAGKESLNDEGR